jgi:hypothetical protein
VIFVHIAIADLDEIFVLGISLDFEINFLELGEYVGNPELPLSRQARQTIRGVSGILIVLILPADTDIEAVTVARNGVAAPLCLQTHSRVGANTQRALV